LDPAGVTASLLLKKPGGVFECHLATPVEGQGLIDALRHGGCVSRPRLCTKGESSSVLGVTVDTSATPPGRWRAIGNSFGNCSEVGRVRPPGLADTVVSIDENKRRHLQIWETLKESILAPLNKGKAEPVHPGVTPKTVTRLFATTDYLNSATPYIPGGSLEYSQVGRNALLAIQIRVNENKLRGTTCAQLFSQKPLGEECGAQ